MSEIDIILGLSSRELEVRIGGGAPPAFGVLLQWNERTLSTWGHGHAMLTERIRYQHGQLEVSVVVMVIASPHPQVTHHRGWDFWVRLLWEE